MSSMSEPSSCVLMNLRATNEEHTNTLRYSTPDSRNNVAHDARRTTSRNLSSPWRMPPIRAYCSPPFCLTRAMKRTLEHAGVVRCDSVTQRTTHVFVLTSTLCEPLELGPSVCVVRWDWLEACARARSLVPVAGYAIHRFCAPVITFTAIDPAMRRHLTRTLSRVGLHAHVQEKFVLGSPNSVAQTKTISAVPPVISPSSSSLSSLSTCDCTLCLTRQKHTEARQAVDAAGSRNDAYSSHTSTSRAAATTTSSTSRNAIAAASATLGSVHGITFSQRHRHTTHLVLPRAAVLHSPKVHAMSVRYARVGVRECVLVDVAWLHAAVAMGAWPDCHSFVLPLPVPRALVPQASLMTSAGSQIAPSTTATGSTGDKRASDTGVSECVSAVSNAARAEDDEAMTHMTGFVLDENMATSVEMRTRPVDSMGTCTSAKGNCHAVNVMDCDNRPGKLLCDEDAVTENAMKKDASCSPVHTTSTSTATSATTTVPHKEAHKDELLHNSAVGDACNDEDCVASFSSLEELLGELESSRSSPRRHRAEEPSLMLLSHANLRDHTVTSSAFLSSSLQSNHDARSGVNAWHGVTEPMHSPVSSTHAYRLSDLQHPQHQLLYNQTINAATAHSGTATPSSSLLLDSASTAAVQRMTMMESQQVVYRRPISVDHYQPLQPSQSCAHDVPEASCANTEHMMSHAETAEAGDDNVRDTESEQSNISNNDNSESTWGASETAHTGGKHTVSTKMGSIDAVAVTATTTTTNTNIMTDTAILPAVTKSSSDQKPLDDHHNNSTSALCISLPIHRLPHDRTAVVCERSARQLFDATSKAHLRDDAPTQRVKKAAISSVRAATVYCMPERHGTDDGDAVRLHHVQIGCGARDRRSSTSCSRGEPCQATVSQRFRAHASPVPIPMSCAMTRVPAHDDTDHAKVTHTDCHAGGAALAARETSAAACAAGRVSFFITNDVKMNVEMHTLRERLAACCSTLTTTPEDCTHMITGRPTKTEPFLCCVAAGKWILMPSFLHEVMAHGALVPEWPHEWCAGQAQRRGQRESVVVLVQSCALQRRARQRAYASWGTAVLCCTSATRADSFEHVLRCGGCPCVVKCTSADEATREVQCRLKAPRGFGNDEDEVTHEPGEARAAAIDVDSAAVDCVVLSDSGMWTKSQLLQLRALTHGRQVLRMDYLVHTLCNRDADSANFALHSTQDRRKRDRTM